MERLSLGLLDPRGAWLAWMKLGIGVVTALVAAAPLRGDDSVLPTPAQNISQKADEDVSPAFEPSSLPVVLEDLASHPVDSQVADLCQTGSLLFSRGDCLAVKACTGSRYTHVAAIVKEGAECWVYDSMNGTGVRKLTLKDYLHAQAPDALTLSHPRRPFSVKECRDFQAALDRELGREYDVLHFVTGREADGIHCAEYMTRVLISIEWLNADNPGRVSPGSLLEGAETCGAYVVGEKILISRPLEPLPEVSNWRGVLWQNTKLCCHAGCRQMSRWVLCR